ncbi:MAG: NF038130 family PEP-CTERM protein [Coleofasciculus sp. D1-CHI-01]|uniref:NF038130 family PEP-CTERM protein n=1 Tax=Coleofasciculus sp. D1-CHI-01 TaxID=3068482 RepID=UPI0032F85840
MKSNLKKLLFGASILASVTGLATAPASATTFTLSGSDIIKYEAIDTNNDGILDTTVANPNADINALLQGNCSVPAYLPQYQCQPGEPGGNLELFASSEQLDLNQFLANQDVTSLQATFDDGRSMTLSSLTAVDWFGEDLNTGYGANTLANRWFSDALDTYNINDSLLGFLGYSQESLYNTFLNSGGFQRFSDANISYVNNDNGTVDIGLAGHYDARQMLLGVSSTQFEIPLQASEVVKVTHNGRTTYAYTFSAADSTLSSNDGTRSHTGVYDPQFTLDPVDVPEPSILLGLIGVGGLVVAKRQSQKS